MHVPVSRNLGTGILGRIPLPGGMSRGGGRDRPFAPFLSRHKKEAKKGRSLKRSPRRSDILVLTFVYVVFSSLNRKKLKLLFFSFVFHI
ncbi:MAG: hypothetical protein CVV44_17180 [Spirochaetae bacterium HGW-Spirochaetae-1]|nr:MAG: hypothetical protein CVV44_17180 [Spirochaetae bacterium HGW-Spirochaetae-1]